MKTAVIIICYNTAKFLPKQVEFIRRFCKDSPEIIVIDNSTLPDAVEGLRHHSGELGCRYIKTNASSLNGSDSHAFSANLAYHMVGSEFAYIMYLDHDAFPIKNFSIPEILGDKVIAGVGQIKGEVSYMWAGCVFLNNDKVDHSLVDFSTNHGLKLDTGGNLHKIIDFYGKDNCIFFDEQYQQNPNFTKSFYNFYTLINDGMFLHCINGSGWNPSEANEERLNSLLNILQDKIDGK